MTSFERDDEPFSVTTLSGLPAFRAVEEMERQMLMDAGVNPASAPTGLAGRASPTTFHVAIDREGTAIGAACSTVGPLAELPLGLALAAHGVEVPSDVVPQDPGCELVSLSVDGPSLQERGITGVTEALYRSFYGHARSSGARSCVVGVDPWLLDVLTEDYGIPFVAIGPIIDLLGREILPVAGNLDDLEAGVLARAPEFAAYLGVRPTTDPLPS